jgi:hypothetical protein
VAGQGDGRHHGDQDDQQEYEEHEGQSISR